VARQSGGGRYVVHHSMLQRYPEGKDVRLCERWAPRAVPTHSIAPHPSALRVARNGGYCTVRPRQSCRSKMTRRAVPGQHAWTGRHDVPCGGRAPDIDTSYSTWLIPVIPQDCPAYTPAATGARKQDSAVLLRSARSARSFEAVEAKGSSCKQHEWAVAGTSPMQPTARRRSRQVCVVNSQLAQQPRPPAGPRDEGSVSQPCQRDRQPEVFSEQPASTRSPACSRHMGGGGGSRAETQREMSRTGGDIILRRTETATTITGPVPSSRLGSRHAPGTLLGALTVDPGRGPIQTLAMATVHERRSLWHFLICRREN
jgi:hypothetical protein